MGVLRALRSGATDASRWNVGMGIVTRQGKGPKNRQDLKIKKNRKKRGLGTVYF